MPNPYPVTIAERLPPTDSDITDQDRTMCIFSRNVSSIADTRIFARGAVHNGQFLVYSMWKALPKMSG